MNLINDGNLIGFWPLTEPSGAPFFRNYSMTYGGNPSGISFDLHVVSSNSLISDGASSDHAAHWPGTTEYVPAGSGFSRFGLLMQGEYEGPRDSQKILTLGHVDFNTRTSSIAGPINGSGVSVGFWCLPTTDGFTGYSSDATAAGEVDQARGNSVITRGDRDSAFTIGVSGQLSGGSQFGNDERLDAYALIYSDRSANPTTGINAAVVKSPIESGHMVHVTCVYEYVDGTSNELRIYADGVLRDSITTDVDMTIDDLNLLDNAWSLGGAEDGTTTIREFSQATGFNKLVSGVYMFNRPLTNAEVEEIHGQGGFQIEDGRLRSGFEVDVADSTLLTYCTVRNDSLSDVSLNKSPLIASQGAGEFSEHALCPGPFGSVGFARTNPTTSRPIFFSSGVLDAIVGSRSFTIGGHVQQGSVDQNNDFGFQAGLAFSIGSVSDRFNTDSTTDSTCGFRMGASNDVDGTNNKFYAQIFDRGVFSENTLLSSNNFEYGDRISTSYVLCYDDQTRGVSFYVDGELAQSGTVTHDFGSHLVGLVGSGFPLVVLGGLQSEVSNTLTTLSVQAGGEDAAVFSAFAFARPLLPEEVRFVVSSGINVSSLERTPHDPRLVGYWPADNFNIGDTIIEDRCASWRRMAANLSWSANDILWNRVESDVSYPWSNVDLFANRSLPPELASFGNLGLTSGVYAVMGGSAGTRSGKGDAGVSDSAYGDVISRYKMCDSDIDLETSHGQDMLIYFEVTPSGNIPPSINDADTTEFNSVIYDFNDGQDKFRGFLTTINSNPDPLGFDAGLGGSGVSIVFTGSESTLITPLASGNLIYGTPNQVLLAVGFDDTYKTADLSSSDDLKIRLYVNGDFVYSRLVPQNVSRMWADVPPKTTSDDFILQIGGYAVDPVSVHAPVADVGLGDNYVRELAILKGRFTNDDLLYFAASGIGSSSSKPGFIDQLSTTQVSINNSALEGYYRFSGGASGELDLSTKANDLVLLAKQAFDDGAITGGTNVESVYNLRFIPGPLEQSDLGVKCSGVSYAGNLPNLNPIPFYVGSGVGFQSPQDGFSVGFRLAKREDPGGSLDFEAILCYGVAPDQVNESNTDPNFGWIIGMDDDDCMRMVLSKDGVSNMYLAGASNAAQAGQYDVGMYQIGLVSDVANTYEQFKDGAFEPARFDSFAHYCFTYDSTTKQLRAYLNGTLVDRTYVDGDIQNPADPTARLLTLFHHQDGIPWVFDETLTDSDAIMTDLFYFSDTLTDQEVRYIAFNGIDSVTGTAVSGTIGGYMQGQDTGSGIIGGLSRGQDSASGIMGGYLAAGTIASGLIGGYVSGVVFGDGTIGGFVQGLDTMSGIMGGYMAASDVGSGMIAGYIQGQDVASGVIGGLIIGGQLASGILGGHMFASDQASGVLGGFIIGGLQGNFDFDASFTVEAIAAKDFDAQLEIAKTASSDFDAKLIIFQDETGPLVEIQTPSSNLEGLAPPFNQYFIGKASGTQGKTITQTRWDFGDFTPVVSVAESGAGCYPVQHRFAGSGFYTVKFEAIDSDGLHASDTLIVNAASGIDPVIVSLSGVPRSGNAGLTVDFDTVFDIIPPGVSIVSRLLAFDDGQSTISLNPTHVYTEPGTYKPIWVVKDSRGVIWSDSLEAGNDYLNNS